ncbi:MAG: low molecular weight phosphotyrosine protein phosphatase [Halorhodospira halophila]|uniref:low molecular weight protein-tyrosine-phosphatase n=1 Tax=Halorhodospira TaxID=85108 RepID=UPI001911DACA|nr:MULTISPECIES: low molecular weight protein-tyrosine-phosphatase [Halorhodospira]MBK5936860.1 phosphotyrosine protein phosphatase [Halorhodospira halophila]MBK5942305.1 phosphotyrosine protein phosphatase [Halorhodospira halophila]MCC3750354.1 low molecular weight phosphotyrosine protein phosphatase [Halorhodospira halophila]MCG5528087.1 low molecular weight phosphotyrosine protein phosphatase [Halorhodospira halophila]MCG5531856.1 low molecular weight phosphotyrosine protein phosphatase [Ha
MKILLVCMGNICRSPTAEGVLRQRLREEGLDHHVDLDSAGTHDFHVGKGPDQRAQEAARRRGVDISDLRARQVERYDFQEHDLILAMDEANLGILQADCPPKHKHKLGLFLDYARTRSEREVPDPYYGGERGFEHVLDLIQDAADGLIDEVRRNQG